MSGAAMSGTLCLPCSAYVNPSFIFGTQVNHPADRPCTQVEPPRSSAPSEEVWRRFSDAQREIKP